MLSAIAVVLKAYNELYHFSDMVSEEGYKSTENIFCFDGHVYAFDSTTIDLCIKVNMLYDVEAQIPGFFYVSTALTNDIMALQKIPYEKYT